MKIGFDAKRAFLNRTGLGNYSRWLINSLALHQPQNQYFLYTTKLNPRVWAPLPGSKFTVVTPAFKFFTSRWRTKGIANDIKRDGIELYHGLSHELPAGIGKTGVRSVVTVHDLIFMRFPQYFGSINRLIYKAKLTYACRTADRIVAISQKTKADLVELLQINPLKIEVIYQGCDASFKTSVATNKKLSVKEKFQLSEHFLLNVGTIEPRKNLLLLVKALGMIPDIKLVVVGKPAAYLSQVKQYLKNNQLTNRVIFLENVPFDDLPAIYQLADCFVYPSRYEGFGIPVLEAITSGVPVVAATGSCLEEAGGAFSLYAGPDNEFQLAEHINRVLNDGQLRQNMIDEGLLYSRNFDDEKLSAQYASLYKNVLENA